MEKNKKTLKVLFIIYAVLIGLNLLLTVTGGWNFIHTLLTYHTIQFQFNIVVNRDVIIPVVFAFIMEIFVFNIDKKVKKIPLIILTCIYVLINIVSILGLLIASLNPSSIIPQYTIINCVLNDVIPAIMMIALLLIHLFADKLRAIVYFVLAAYQLLCLIMFCSSTSSVITYYVKNRDAAQLIGLLPSQLYGLLLYIIMIILFVAMGITFIKCRKATPNTQGEELPVTDTQPEQSTDNE